MFMTWKRHKLRLVKEKEAQGRTSEIYLEIKQALAVPYVNTMFQALASFPEFFDLFWKAARPVLATQEFFSFSERLGAEAFTRVHNYFHVPSLGAKAADMFSAGAQHELRELLELYHYNYPILLLLAAALVEAIENPGAEKCASTPARVVRRNWPRPIIVEEETAPAPTRKIYEDIKRTLGTPFLHTCYLSMGRWPDFLKICWESLAPLMKSPIYEQQRAAMCDSAVALARELPEPLQLSSAQMEEAGVPADDVHQVTQLADLFLNLLAKQVLNVAFAKIGLGDGESEEIAA
jgi:hypothetical protein